MRKFSRSFSLCLCINKTKVWAKFSHERWYLIKKLFLFFAPFLSLARRRLPERCFHWCMAIQEPSRSITHIIKGKRKDCGMKFLVNITLEHSSGDLGRVMRTFQPLINDENIFLSDKKWTFQRSLCRQGSDFQIDNFSSEHQESRVMTPSQHIIFHFNSLVTLKIITKVGINFYGMTSAYADDFGDKAEGSLSTPERCEQENKLDDGLIKLISSDLLKSLLPR